MGQKKSRKIPAKFPTNFPAKNQEKSPTSFCRSAGRKKIPGAHKIGAAISGPELRAINFLKCANGCGRFGWARHRAGESEPRPTSGSTSGTTSGPTSGPTSASTRSPTRAPTRLDFPVFSPSRTPHESSHETSHEGVHPKHQNLLFWDLSLFLKFRLKSPNLVDFGSWKCLFYWVRKKRFRLILKTDF